MSGNDRQKAVTQRPTVQELSALAARGDRPDYPLTDAERLLWYELREVYRDWRKDASDLSGLKSRKEDAIVCYDKMVREAKQHTEDCARIAKLFKALDLAASDYQKNPAMETADRVMNIVYGLLGGE